MLWSRVSKAFDKSRYTLMGVVPLSKCCVILSTSYSYSVMTMPFCKMRTLFSNNAIFNVK